MSQVVLNFTRLELESVSSVRFSTWFPGRIYVVPEPDD